MPNSSLSSPSLGRLAEAKWVLSGVNRLIKARFPRNTLYTSLYLQFVSLQAAFHCCGLCIIAYYEELPLFPFFTTNVAFFCTFRLYFAILINFSVKIALISLNSSRIEGNFSLLSASVCFLGPKIDFNELSH